ncbi:hypothetical protein [Paraglaciecola sp.]|uniref:hypothetical protein n=1 Tax=Paraglaciecola sp. TaxID=1920173 RepID=UPI003EF8C454
MLEINCNFTALAGDILLKKLDDEFQYQMSLTDGQWVFWQDPYFYGHNLEPATNVVAQAILQYFAGCACPFSMLRLARSLSPRNAHHGPITSDEMTVSYLLQGLEIIENNLHDPYVKTGFTLYISQLEFRLACELFTVYKKEFKSKLICPSVTSLVEHAIGGTTTDVLQ